MERGTGAIPVVKKLIYFIKVYEANYIAGNSSQRPLEVFA